MYKCPDCNNRLLENMLSFECINDKCNFYLGKEKYIQTYVIKRDFKEKIDFPRIRKLYNNKNYKPKKIKK